MMLILTNTISLAMKFHTQPSWYSKALDISNIIFSTAFAIEFLLKLFAFRFKVSLKFDISILIMIFKCHFFFNFQLLKFKKFKIFDTLIDAYD